MSAFGGKPEIHQPGPNVCFLSKLEIENQTTDLAPS